MIVSREDAILTTGHDYTYYLYDNGVLVATFDDDDNELELFVNGPEGMIATYHNNDQEYLYLYVKDQVGSPRITMHQPFLGIHCQMVHYTNYHPFGGVLESSGSFASAFKFSGKEHDEESSFDYHYFGARYYDARLGTFSSIDKAGQFASGYLYGGNNPLLGRDPDGNSFIAFASWAIKTYYIGKATYDGYKDGGILGAIKNYYVSSWTQQLSSAVGSSLKPVSDIASTAASSVVYSGGNSIMYGTDVTMGFGFGSYSLTQGKWAWTSVKGKWYEAAGGTLNWAGGVGAVMKDATRIQIELRGDTEQIKDALNDNPRPDNVGEWIYTPSGTTNPDETLEPVSTTIPDRLLKTGGDADVYSYTGEIPEEYELVHRRMNNFLHWVGYAEVKDGTIVNVLAGEYHQNYWPTVGLGGLNALPHGLFENGWGPMPIFSAYYNNKAIFYSVW